ncbi:MAG: HAD family hydrolase [Verrucomicrobiota bacterium]
MRSSSTTVDSMTNKETILFDLDGTLIDHFTTIHRSIAYAQEQLGLPQSSYETVKATVGGSITVTLERLLGANQVEAALVHFKAHFREIMFEDVFALPGAGWILQALKERGYKVGVYTNKIQKHSEETLTHLGLDQWLDQIIGTGEHPYRKPQPEFTLYALDQIESSLETTLLIGDSPFDYQTGANAQMDVILVATGTHNQDQLFEETGCDAIYPDLYELGYRVFGLDAQQSAHT